VPGIANGILEHVTQAPADHRDGTAASSTLSAEWTVDRRPRTIAAIARTLPASSRPPWVLRASRMRAWAVVLARTGCCLQVGADHCTRREDLARRSGSLSSD